MGVGFVVETARWRCPDGVAILKVTDLKLSLPLALVWRKDNLSPLLSRLSPMSGPWLSAGRRVRPRHHFQTPNARRTATI